MYIKIIEEFGTNIFNQLIKKKAVLGFDVLSRDIQDHILDSTSKKVVQINGTTMDEIKLRVLDGIDKGKNIDEIAGTIDNLYLDQIIPNRSKVIATTEVASCSNYGSLMGAIQSGADVLKKWVPIIDSRTRDTHRAMYSYPAIDIIEYFYVGDSKMQYPGDFNGSAEEVVNCRCTLQYISNELSETLYY